MLNFQHDSHGTIRSDVVWSGALLFLPSGVILAFPEVLKDVSAVLGCTYDGKWSSLEQTVKRGPEIKSTSSKSFDSRKN